MGCLNSQEKKLREENMRLELKLSIVQIRLKSLSKQLVGVSGSNKALQVKYEYLKREQPNYWDLDTEDVRSQE